MSLRQVRMSERKNEAEINLLNTQADALKAEAGKNKEETQSIIDKELIPLLPKMRVDGSSYGRPFKKNGDLQKWPKEYCDRVGLTREDIGGPFTCVEYVDFDPSKDARVKETLMDAGFLSPEFNTSKKPWNTFEIRKALRNKTYAQVS